jgi:hypothetical protein
MQKGYSKTTFGGMTMKLPLKLLALFAVGWANAHGAPGPTNSAVTDRVLVIEPSFMPISGGKATLTIGALRRTNGVYCGDYKMKVSPYFFKNEKGRLAIIVSDESLAKIDRGTAAAIIGTATTGGRGGSSRHIDATAMPADINHGRLNLWFMAGDRKMVFEPAYHFAEIATAAIPANATEAGIASNVPR